MSHAPFGAVDWAILAAGVGLGGVAGWWRGRMTTIEKHADDGTLRAQASPIGLILIAVLLVFVAAMIAVQRLEMFIRARRILSGGTDAHVETTP